ncbi:SDR family oxidoreductase [Actinomycetospora sp. NBRC 106378]|uniref:SDR family oxidoreductase n=1 Tax=Actinomycetospora sp. NBRC 106378 TaxID=3032208 RepID=UPI0024A03F1B|nr:SDR family oxidoreductase [Actinomycetospora sp. NBRC 106378]GLZ56340.1 oxidoreductase [Actinomycetospora sp. NBRC 106378]
MDAPVVVITGASSGIGEATARLLDAQGARLALGARRADRLEALAAELGGEARIRPTDVRRREDVRALVDLAVQAHGRLDVLVSNAGVARIAPLEDQAVEDWEEMIDVNLRAVLYGIEAALPHFRAQGSGHVVNVVSTSGLRIVPGQAVYAATKNAVRTLSEALRQEAGPDLRVTAVSPGMTRTELVDSVPDAGARAAARERMDEIGMPADAIARAIAFAIEQPPGVDVGEIVVRPTAQG